MNTMQRGIHSKKGTGRQGFTLIESLVAIAILTVAIVAPFQAIQNVTKASQIAKEKLIAASLAQEALEYVRFVRDGNYLANPSSYNPLNYLALCVGAAKACAVDTTVNIVNDPSVALSACGSPSTCSPMYLNPTGLYYTQASAGNTKTIYTRSLNIIDHNTYQTATATVTWEDHGTNTTVITEDFYDWL